MHRFGLPFLVVTVALACQAAPAPPPKAKPAESPVRQDAQASAVVIETAHGEQRFRVELAATPPERARGLMFREHLDDDAGMLFLFDRMDVQSFWMKNTKIPLDMLFIDEQGVIVGIVENAEPLTLSSRSVGLPSRYVLELVGGTSRRLGIAAGQRVRFVGVPGHPAKATGPVR